MEMTIQDTGLEVLDLRHDAAFARRSLHSRDIGMQMAGLQRLSRALLEFLALSCRSWSEPP